MKFKRLAALVLAMSLVLGQENVAWLTVQAEEITAETEMEAVEETTELTGAEESEIDEPTEPTEEQEEPEPTESTGAEESEIEEPTEPTEEQEEPEPTESTGVEESEIDELTKPTEETESKKEVEEPKTPETVGEVDALKTAEPMKEELKMPELSEELAYQEIYDAFAALAEDHDVYALLQCASTDIMDAPGDEGNLVVTIRSGHQVRLLDVKIMEGTVWYQVEALVNGVTYIGYLYDGVLVSADEGLAEWKEAYKEIVDAYAVNSVSSSVNTSGAGTTDLSAFPESYQSYIKELIAKHPNWTFVPLKTGLDWSTVIENEMTPARNLVPLNSMDTWKGSNEVLSAPYWVQASESIVRYYMDPRNFLNETSVFQFELLTYNSKNHKESGVKAILKNTFMSDTVVDTVDGKELTYAQAFMKIGQALNISPYHLASRVRQEQGTEGTSSLISGTYPGYEGLYNYFNIQASGATMEEIIANGLQEAKDGGWTSRYLALYGGSEKVGKNYISVGQNTLYLQKFDVDNSDGKLYWHQYMQNLLAADNEGKSVKKGYEDMGVLDNSFVFSIPVYENMPSSACKMPTDTLEKPTLKASVSGYSKVTLTWSEVAGAQGYEIYRSTSKNGEYTKVETITSVGTMTYSTSIPAKTTYYYKVRGYKTLGGVTSYSDFSSQKKASSVITTPEWDSLQRTKYSEIHVSWKKVKSVTGYQIYRKTGKDGSYTKIATVKGASTLSYKDKTVLPNNTYYYKVRAYKTVDGKNRYSSYNAEKSKGTKITASALTSVVVAGNNKLTLKWEKVTGVNGYRIYRADSANGSYKMVKEITKATTTSYTDNKLSSNGTYYYKIRAFVTVNKKKYYSSYSNVILGNTKLSKPKVSSITASSPTSVKLKWKAVTSATGYQIYRATSYNGKYTRVKTISKNATVSYTDTKLTPGKTYYYKVRAFSKVNDNTEYSKFSSIVSICPELDATEIKSISNVKTTSAKISWDKVEGAEGYRLYQATSPSGKYSLVKTLSGSDKCAYTHTSLKKGKTYYYKVRAYVKVDGKYKYSTYSSVWSVQTKK